MLLNGDLGKLRDRLRWLANRAAAEGHPEYARLLMQLAAEAFEQAEDMKLTRGNRRTLRRGEAATANV